MPDHIDSCIAAPHPPAQREEMTFKALAACVPSERIVVAFKPGPDNRRFADPLLRVGPVRSGSLREFEKIDPR